MPAASNKPSRLLRGAAALWQGLAKALCPDACMACGRLLPPDEGRPGSVSSALCAPCAESIRAVAGPLCVSCGAVFAGQEGPDHLCQACMDRKNHFSRARAEGLYEGGLASAVKRYKYGKRLWMAEPLSLMLENACSRHFPGEAFDLVMPVPLFPARLRWRGFNQVQAMLVCWEKRKSLPGRLANGLSRIRATLPQAGLGGKERARNVRGAFRVEAETEIKGRTVLLVDDVYTTGATAREAARTLIRAGAGQVDVLTIARVEE